MWPRFQQYFVVTGTIMLVSSAVAGAEFAILGLQLIRSNHLVFFAVVGLAVLAGWGASQIVKGRLFPEQPN